MKIIIDDLNGPADPSVVRRAPSQHAPALAAGECARLALEGLRKPEITMWSAHENGELLGCGALKELNAEHGEIKSMRTAARHLRKGVARKLLDQLINEACRRGYTRLSLETGSMAAFHPARQLYEQSRFSYCGRFADYIEDPNSVFMTKQL